MELGVEIVRETTWTFELYLASKYKEEEEEIWLQEIVVECTTFFQASTGLLFRNLI